MRELDPILLKQNIEKRLKQDLEEGNVSGVSIYVSQNGKTVYEHLFGEKTPDTGIPLERDTVFRLASMTKPITAVAIMILVQRGRLSLEDEVSKYFPAFKEKYIAKLSEDKQIVRVKKAQEPVRIFHLLTHTAGVGSGPISDVQLSQMPEDALHSLEKGAEYFAEMDLHYEPYTATSYSGLASFDLLARIVEMVSGQDIETFIKEEICRPCGMVDTTFLPSEEHRERMVSVSNKVDGRAVKQEVPEKCVFIHFPETHCLGGAGLISTMPDYVRFAQMLLQKGIIDGNRVLEEKWVQLMCSPYVSPELMKGDTRWGLGVRVIVKDGNTLPAGSFGWSGAYGTHFWIDPDNQIIAIYMKNSYYDGGAGATTAKHFEEDVTASFKV